MLPAHYFRDLTPCLYWRGLIFAAPKDTPSILALDAATGERLWDSEQPPITLGRRPSDAIHLLGVAGGHLIASGDQLYWIGPATGQVAHCWPDGDRADPRGYGRGLLIGNEIYWPTRERIHVFDQHSARQTRPVIELARRGVSGGNLLVAAGHLIIATDRELVAFRVSK